MSFPHLQRALARWRRPKGNPKKWLLSLLASQMRAEKISINFDLVLEDIKAVSQKIVILSKQCFQLLKEAFPRMEELQQS